MRMKLLALLVMIVIYMPSAAQQAGLSFGFSSGFSSDMVLQRGPSKAAVYGFGHGPVTVRVAGTDEAGGAVSYSVAADPAAAAAGGGGGGGGDGVWKAFLKPSPAGGSYTVTATSATGDSAVLERVTYGDVYFCSGQSNSECGWLACGTSDFLNFCSVPQTPTTSGARNLLH